MSSSPENRALDFFQPSREVDRRENGDADLEDPKIASVEGDALAESECSPQMNTRLG